MAHLTPDDKKKIIEAAKKSQNSFDGFRGTNRTIVDKTIYYGISDALKALRKK